MKNWLEKIDWDKLRIRNRRDWAIFWIFAALICYAVGSRFGFRNERWLLQFANPYMTDLNQPHSWGEAIGFCFLLAAVMETVLMLCKKSVKAKILVLIGVLLAPMLIVAGYKAHTDLIVSPFWKEEPVSVSIHLYGGEDGTEERSIDQRDLTPEQIRELMELCRTMTAVSDKGRQEELLQWYREASDQHMIYQDSIWLHFEESYGHGYSFLIRIYDGQIYLLRGFGSTGWLITFFEDNGIIQWLEGL